MRSARLAVAVAAAAVVCGSAGGATAAQPTGFACYPAQFSAFTPQKLALVDAVARTRLSLLAVAPERVCAPAGDTEAVADTSSYLICYTLKAPSFAQRDVLLRDGLATLAMRVLRPTSACVPTARIDTEPSAPSKALDLYTCYAVKPRSSLDGTKTVVGDAFGSSTESVSLATRLCAPASAPDQLLLRGRQYLTCYRLDSKVKATTVVLHNDFGFLKAALGPRDHLCLRATRLR